MSASDAGTIELRPDLAEHRALLRSRALFGIPLLVIVGLRVARDPGTGLIVLAALVILGAVGVTHVRTTRVTLTPTSVQHHSAVFPDRVIDRADARGVLGFMTQPLSADVQTLVVQSRSTGDSLRIFGGLWNPDQLATIAEHAGAEVLDQPVSAQEMDRHVPGSLPLRYRRPILFAVLAAIVVVGLVVGGIIWFFDANDLSPATGEPR